MNTEQDLFAGLSEAAKNFHNEYWHWVFHGPDGDRTTGDKRKELRAKYGVDAEAELLEALRAAGLLRKSTSDSDCQKRLT